MTSRACSRLAEPNPVLIAAAGLLRPAVVPVHARGPSNYPLTYCSTSSPLPKGTRLQLSCRMSPLLGIRIARTCLPWLAQGHAVHGNRHVEPRRQVQRRTAEFLERQDCNEKLIT